MKRRKFAASFKNMVIKEVGDVGKVIPVAMRHEISPNLVRRWISEDRKSLTKKAQVIEKRSEVKGTESYQSQTERLQGTQEVILDKLERAQQEILQLKLLLGQKELDISKMRSLLSPFPRFGLASENLLGKISAQEETNGGVWQ